MGKATMFKFGEDLEEGFPPMPPRLGGPPASILGSIFRDMKHHAECIAESPNGYECIVGPKRAMINREFTVEATFAARPFAAQDATQEAWWRGLTDVERRRFPIEVRIDSTRAFDLSSATQTLELGCINRVVSATFLVRPVVPGTHSLRVSLKYPGGRREVVFNWAIKIRTRFMDVVQKVGVIIAALAGLVGVLKAIGVW